MVKNITIANKTLHVRFISKPSILYTSHFFQQINIYSSVYSFCKKAFWRGIEAAFKIIRKVLGARLLATRQKSVFYHLWTDRLVTSDPIEPLLDAGFYKKNNWGMFPSYFH
jgi:hypothetical protein